MFNQYIVHQVEHRWDHQQTKHPGQIILHGLCNITNYKQIQ